MERELQQLKVYYDLLTPSDAFLERLRALEVPEASPAPPPARKRRSARFALPVAAAVLALLLSVRHLSPVPVTVPPEAAGMAATPGITARPASTGTPTAAPAPTPPPPTPQQTVRSAAVPDQTAPVSSAPEKSPAPAPSPAPAGDSPEPVWDPGPGSGGLTPDMNAVQGPEWAPLTEDVYGAFGDIGGTKVITLLQPETGAQWGRNITQEITADGWSGAAELGAQRYNVQLSLLPDGEYTITLEETEEGT